MMEPQNARGLATTEAIKFALLQVMAPIQMTAGVFPAAQLGLGPSAPMNLALRKRLQKLGAPFGGIGFFDPHANLGEADSVPPPELTAATLKAAKLAEFQACAMGRESMYYYALQPIYDSEDRIWACEILVRARNGTDSAPFEDVLAIADPGASENVKAVYAAWKATEMVDWTLKVLKGHPVLQAGLTAIHSNVRPLDLDPSSQVFAEVKRRLEVLSFEDRVLLQSKLRIEVTEDQIDPGNIGESLERWRELGFKLPSYDDTIGDTMAKVLGRTSVNFHTCSALKPIEHNFESVKVDMDWAGFGIFLSHPAYNSDPKKKAEVLHHAKDEDLVYVPAGPALRNTGAKHSMLVDEFVDWAIDMLRLGHTIVIELSVRQDDENNAYAIRMLKDRGVDIFGEHKRSFFFQGGPTGAKAFVPDVLASALVSEASTRKSI